MTVVVITPEDLAVTNARVGNTETAIANEVSARDALEKAVLDALSALDTRVTKLEAVPVPTPAPTPTPTPVPTPTPTPSAITSVDDALLTYNGIWSIASDPVNKYQGSDRYSNSVGATFFLTFTGTKIALIGALAPHHGIASVQLDAALAVDADLYSATRSESAAWWISPTLAAGQHRVTVTVTGRKSAASTGTVVSIDRVDITDGTIVAPTPVPTPTPTPVPTPIPTPLPGQAARPSYNTGTGFFVIGKKLYDANGYEFRIRGVNKAHYDANQYDVINNMKANAVRWSMYDPANTMSAQVAAANAWITRKIVPIPGNWDGTCKNDAASLTAIVDLWVAKAALWTTVDLQKFAIINIANEWGPDSSAVWRDSYITAISRMRAAGYKQTLLIDTGGCGQNLADLLNYSQVVFDSDPQKNIIFGQHIYGQWSLSPASWQTNFTTGMQQLGALPVPVLIGEFGPGRNIGPSPTLLAPRDIMQAAENQGLGWLAWAVDDNNLAAAKSDDLWFSMLYANFVYNSSADLTIFGKVVVDDPTYGLKALAVKAAALTGIPPLV